MRKLFYVLVLVVPEVLLAQQVDSVKNENLIEDMGVRYYHGRNYQLFKKL
jgi:hypothetical protein